MEIKLQYKQSNVELICKLRLNNNKRNNKNKRKRNN